MKNIIENFEKYGHEKKFKKGDIIAKSGSPSDHLYFVVSGSISVSKKVGNKEIVFATFKENEFFGEMSLISHRKHMSTIESVSDSVVLTLTEKKVETLLNENSLFALDIIKGLIERLRKTDKYLVEAFNMALEIDKAVQL